MQSLHTKVAEQDREISEIHELISRASAPTDVPSASSYEAAKQDVGAYWQLLGAPEEEEEFGDKPADQV